MDNWPRSERAYLTDVVETIERATGRRPEGWLGPALTETPDTPELLAELGLTSVPYSIEVNDIPLFVGTGMSGADLYQVVVDQFDVLYAESESSARVMSMGLHPFVSGVPFRHEYLVKALEYVLSHDGVWATTSDEIAEWYLGWRSSMVSASAMLVPPGVPVPSRRSCSPVSMATTGPASRSGSTRRAWPTRVTATRSYAAMASASAASRRR